MYIVYGASFCSWCQRAKDTLEQAGVTYKYIDIQTDSSDWKEVAEKNNFKTIPQVFKDGVYLGGFNELAQTLIADKI